MPKPIPQPAAPFSNPHEDEERTVHTVYEAIAPHFSQTRFKPWPLIAQFLSTQPPGSIGLDSGAGNGKYLPVAHQAGCEMIALDRSSGLLSHARKMGFGGLNANRQEDGKEGTGDGSNVAECVRGDMGVDVWRAGVFDFVISIAAVHHLSTPERRQHAVQIMLRPLRLSSQPPYGRFMIYVWAYEQGESSRRKMGTAFSAAASKPDNEVPSSAVSPLQEKEEQKKEKIQDVLVPWVLAPKKGETSKKPKETKQPNPKQRKQSKERQQSPEESISGVENLHIDSSVLPSGSKPQSKTSLSEPMKSLEPEPIPKPESGPEPQVFHRYYHLFTAGELQSLVEAAGRAEGFCVIPSQSNGDDGNQTTKETDIEDGDDRDRIEGSVVEREEVVGRCEAGGEGKWLRVRAVGWEMDNWWLEGEVGK
ncbi:tRNA (uracil-5-)-methyltransferase TRM9 [Cryptococcus neoformans Tu401-1]|nr:tRNA (uracil-5-)-methyltransferase TRM9 [Cryptococcus neoformans var. grubii Bt85]OXG14773.1 tRNA (uracil-5-)-methyltransferase TRM9 [Cryptococcus neoformans var. grubii Tu401-1]OXM77862.1 tRNA (uracil-5-)-methyltransferase TRM9 [Cryptococcus neoformans var. grubii Bt63]